MKKMLLAILAVVPFGIFAQEVRYVTVPTSQSTTPAPTYTSTTTTTTQTYQQSPGQTSTLVRSNELFRDTLKNSEKRAIHTTFIKNNFWDNWYITVGGGIGILMSEESRYAGYWNIGRPTAAFTVGKWINPVVGARFNVTASKLQGFATWHDNDPNIPHWGWGDYYVGKNYTKALETLLGNKRPTNTYLNAQVVNPENPSNSIYVDQNIPRQIGSFIEDTFLDLNRPRHTSRGDGYDYFTTYAAGSLDLLIDAVTLFDRYKPNRFFHLNLFAGTGFSHTFKEERWVADVDGTKPGNHNAAGQVERSKTAVNLIMAKAGMEMTFRLSKQMNLNLEGSALILPEIFDRRAGNTHTFDIVANFLVGFSYKFNERFFYEPLCSTTTYTQQQVTCVNNTVNDTHSNCSEDIIARLKRIEEILLQPAPSPAATAPDLSDINADLEHLKVVVYFIIDKWEVRQSEMYKLDEIAKFMAKYPKIRVSVSGYADAQTAYPAYNMKLSERRANEVTRILTTKYGIDRSRLRIEHYGDTVQPFDVNELNRAVIAFDIPEN